MPTIVNNCPRCAAQHMTFDVVADVWVGSEHGWLQKFEICIVCRRCRQPSMLRVHSTVVDDSRRFSENGSVVAMVGDLEPKFRSRGFVNLADISSKSAPEFLPDQILAAFSEGSKCLAVGCPNAACAMFRLSLDLATKSLLPTGDANEGPNQAQRTRLAARLDWLFANGRLPEDLKRLSLAVKDNGNDGVHDGNLDADDAEDMYDFAFALLDRMFAEPKRIELAHGRREARRAQTAKAKGDPQS